MRSRLAFGCVVLVLVGVAASWPRPTSPRGREATALLVALSLWHDHDLRYEAADQARGFRVWEQGPSGLRLRKTEDGGWRFAGSWLLPLLASPLVPIVQSRATAVATTLLLSLLLAAAWRRANDERWRLLAVGCVAGGALLPWALRGEPILLVAAAAGGAAALAAAPRPRSRARLVVIGGLAAIAAFHCWSRDAGVRSFAARFPFDRAGEEGVETAPSRQEWQGLGAAAEDLVGVFAGRSSGLLVTAPFFLLAAALSFERRRWAVAVAALAIVAVELFRPAESARWGLVALTPACFWLVRRPPSRAALAVTAAVLGFLSWPLQAARDAVRPEPWVARWLPLEISRLHADPHHVLVARAEALWLVPRASAFPDERHARGVWLRGAARSEWVLVSTHPVDRLALTVSSLADNELVVAAGGRSARVRFDSEEKRNGTPLEIVLGPSSLRRGPLFPGRLQYAYQIAFQTDGGAVPHHLQRRSQDERSLGAFIALPD